MPHEKYMRHIEDYFSLLLLSDSVVKLCLSPLSRLGNLGCLIEGGIADRLGSFHDPLGIFASQHVQVFLTRPLVISHEVRFVIGDEVRSEYQAGYTELNEILSSSPKAHKVGAP